MFKETVGAGKLYRVSIITATSEGRMHQRNAAVRLGLCVRQVKRLVRRCREGGAATACDP